MKYCINVPLIELVKGKNDNICRPYRYNFYLIPTDGTYPKVMLLKQTTLPNSFLKSYPKFLFSHPKYEPSENGVYAKLSKDKESPFKTLFVKFTLFRENLGIPTVPSKKPLQNDASNSKKDNTGELTSIENTLLHLLEFFLHCFSVHSSPYHLLLYPRFL